MNHDRIASLESLRGILALWVVVGHTIRHCGYSDRDLGILKAVAMPGLAVDVFIILSGFVIFALLDRQPTSYLEFIVRRWFRLAPVFMGTLIVAVFTLDQQARIIDAFPWPNTAIANDLAIHLDTLMHVPQHLLAHVLMMHGAIADRFLMSSQYAFVGQAWSISVEWQFYLVAPVIFYLIANRHWYRLCSVVLFICVLRMLNYGGEGFAINQAGYFLIGIVSYYLWKQSERFELEPQMIDMIAVVLAALVFLLLSRTVSLLIWIAALSCVIAEKRRVFTVSQKALSYILHLPFLQWLGKISYSIYMVHMLVFYLLTQWLMTLWPGIGKPMFAAVMVPSVALVTTILSALTYQYVELPGIRLGRRAELWMKTMPARGRMGT